MNSALLRALAPAQEEEEKNLLSPILLGVGIGLSLSSVVATVLIMGARRGRKKNHQRGQSKSTEGKREDGPGASRADTEAEDSALTTTTTSSPSLSHDVDDVDVDDVYRGIMTYSRLTLPLRKGARGRMYLQNFLNSEDTPTELVKQYCGLSEAQVNELVRLLRAVPSRDGGHDDDNHNHKGNKIVDVDVDDVDVDDVYRGIMTYSRLTLPLRKGARGRMYLQNFLNSEDAPTELVKQYSGLSEAQVNELVRLLRAVPSRDGGHDDDNHNHNKGDKMVDVDVDEVYQGIATHSRMNLPLPKGKKGWAYLQSFLKSEDAPAELVAQYSALSEQQVGQLHQLLKSTERLRQMRDMRLNLSSEMLSPGLMGNDTTTTTTASGQEEGADAAVGQDGGVQTVHDESQVQQHDDDEHPDLNSRWQRRRNDANEEAANIATDEADVNADL